MSEPSDIRVQAWQIGYTISHHFHAYNTLCFNFLYYEVAIYCLKTVSCTFALQECEENDNDNQYYARCELQGESLSNVYFSCPVDDACNVNCSNESLQGLPSEYSAKVMAILEAWKPTEYDD